MVDKIEENKVYKCIPKEAFTQEVYIGYLNPEYMKTTKEWIELIEGHDYMKEALLEELRIKQDPTTNNDKSSSLYVALLGSFSWSGFERLYGMSLMNFAEKAKKHEINLKSCVVQKEFSHYNI